MKRLALLAAALTAFGLAYWCVDRVGRRHKRSELR
jgi:hypothetical protein